jgi:multiple sugar transport system ATP-binding protein
MNLVEMTLERAGDRPVLRSGPLTLPAPGRLAGPALGAIASAVIVGVRPEHIRVASPPRDGDAVFRGRCDLVEYLGHRVLVHVRVGDLELTALVDPAVGVRAGDDVDCSIPRDRLHLFDSGTGRSLGAEGAARGGGTAES